MAVPLSGHHALVTGGSRGIGAAIGMELARLGASLTLLGRDMDALQASAAGIAQAHGVVVHGIRCDVADDRNVHEAFAEAAGASGPITVLVNNAGIAPAAKFAAIDRKTWDRVFAVNVTGAFLCIQQVLPEMLKARRGRIVNVASTASFKGVSHGSAYAASKHALLGLTRTLALETAKHGITVNAVSPGYTDTDMAGQAADNLVRALGVSREEAEALILKTIPRRRLIEPAEVAAAVGWLCSPAAAGVTGQNLVVAGGEGA